MSGTSDSGKDAASDAPASVIPTFGEATRLWLKVGLISFGGPAGQITILDDELAERRRWIDERGFLTALNFCMLLPGPEAQQLATYMGLKPHGLRGALAAGLLFVLPGPGYCSSSPGRLPRMDPGRRRRLRRHSHGGRAYRTWLDPAVSARGGRRLRRRRLGGPGP